MRGCRVHRLIARRARRLGSRRASHLIDEERKRSCTGSVHSSGSFCTKRKAWTPRTPLSWSAAGASDQMPAARGPEMHHSSLCAGTYPQGLRDANGLAKGRCGEVASAGFLLRGKQDRIQWSIFPLSATRPGGATRLSASRAPVSFLIREHSPNAYMISCTRPYNVDGLAVRSAGAPAGRPLCRGSSVSGPAVSVTTNRGSAYSFSNSQYTRWASTRNRCKSKSSPSSASTLSVVRLPSSNVSTTSRKRGE